MRRLIVAAALAAGILGAVATAAPREQIVNVTVDQRPVDRAGGIAVFTGGAVYADIVDMNRAFNGLLLFRKGGVQINIGGSTAAFTVGRKQAVVRSQNVLLPAAVFVRNAHIYVPLSVIAELAGANLSVDRSHRKASIITNLSASRANPLATPTLSALAALSLKTSGQMASDGLHLNLTVSNTTNAPFTLRFPNGARVGFQVTKDGSLVWDSIAGKRFVETVGTVTLGPGESTIFTDVWPQFTAGAGRYMMNARLMTSPPIQVSPKSLSDVVPVPTPS